MEFLSLKIKNFLTIGEADLRLDNQGLVLIQGVNEDNTSAVSNGAGKSTIADALCWVLNEVTARDITGDKVVNRIAKKDCMVRTEIQDGASRYQITRYRKDKTFKNQSTVFAFDGVDYTIDMTKGTEKETQEVITSIVGCSHEVFRAAIYAGQEEAPDIPAMTDRELKRLVEESAGIDRLEAAYEIARKKLNEAKSLLSADTASMSVLTDNFKTVDLDLAKKTLEAESFEKAREGKAQAFRTNADAQRTNLLALGAAIKGADEPALKASAERVKTALDAHSAKLSIRDGKKTEFSSAQRDLDRASATFDTLTDDLRKRLMILKNAETEVKKPCVACGKPGDEHDLATFKAHQEKGVAEATAKRAEAKEKVAALQDILDKKVRDLVDYEATLPDMSALLAESDDINAKLREIASKKSDFAVGKKEFDRQNELAASALTETNPHESAISSLTERKLKIQQSIDEKSKRLAEHEEALQVFESVAKVFGPAGVRAHILDTVTPFLNDRTADYLSVLSDGNCSAVWNTLSTTAKGDAKEKFNIEVSDLTGADSFKGLSGGEKRKVRLATILALQDLVASRASKPINLWIGDEIDDALDPAGRERLMGVLERKARDRGTVLIISHNELRDWVDNVMTVTKKGGYSSIEGALCLS